MTRNFTLTDIRKTIRRANCCFADIAFLSAQNYSIGSRDKGFCEFEKAETLYHAIKALRCWVPDGTYTGQYTGRSWSDSNAVYHAGETPYINFSHNLLFIVDALIFNSVDITPSVTPTSFTSLADAVNAIKDALTAQTGYTWTVSITIDTDAGTFDFIFYTDAALAEYEVSFSISVSDLTASVGAGFIMAIFDLELETDHTEQWADDLNCVSADSLIAKIDSICGCCSCRDSSYDLSVDTVFALESNIELLDDNNFELLDGN